MIKSGVSEQFKKCEEIPAVVISSTVITWTLNHIHHTANSESNHMEKRIEIKTSYFRHIQNLKVKTFSKELSNIIRNREKTKRARKDNWPQFSITCVLKEL